MAWPGRTRASPCTVSVVFVRANKSASHWGFLLCLLGPKRRRSLHFSFVNGGAEHGDKHCSSSFVIVGTQRPRKNWRSHIDASHSRQPLVKGERLVRYEVNAVMTKLRCFKNITINIVCNSWACREGPRNPSLGTSPGSWMCARHSQGNA